MKKGFTLIEILITILIIAVLATLALPLYNKTKERIYDQQAFADLKLIQTAQKGYHIDMGIYYYPTTTDQPAAILQLNNGLKLNLPANSARRWNYLVTDTGCGQAVRLTGDRAWCLSVSDPVGTPAVGVCGWNCS